MYARSMVVLTAMGLVLPASGLRSAESDVRTFTQVVTAGQAEYKIEVGGALDPENVEIALENLGETPVKDPWLTVNALYDWFDIDSMVREITAGCQTEEEKALAIWDWVQWKRFQRSPHDESSLHPVRAMNGYGYGICGHTASWVKALCRAAGLKARVWELSGHTVSEAYYGGGWHMLDGNVKVFYLARDNRTIASVEELQKDSWLIERTIHPQDPWVRQKDPSGRNIQFVRYLTTERDNWVSDGYDSENKRPYSMAMTLKPAEKLLRWWKPVLGRFEGASKAPLAPDRYANGQLVWEPDLEKVDLLDYLQFEKWDRITSSRRDGRRPAIHLAELQTDLYPRPGTFSLPIRSPYPMVGARFWCTLVKEGESDRDAASVGFDGLGWGGGKDIYSFLYGKGAKDLEFDLDSWVRALSSPYGYRLIFSLKGNRRANPPTQSGLDRFKSITDLQVSPHSLPALSRGENIIRYRDRSSGARKVRITHAWRERSDNHAPSKVSRAVAPESGQAVSARSPSLRWEPARDQDQGDGVVDYQVMVSLRPDCRWPLSPSLYRSVGSPACEWKVPESFLNPGTTYYWKVRARDGRGATGPWSEAFSFTVSASAP